MQGNLLKYISKEVIIWKLKNLLNASNYYANVYLTRAVKSKKTVVIENIKPSSFSWVMNCLYEYIEIHEGGLK